MIWFLFAFICLNDFLLNNVIHLTGKDFNKGYQIIIFKMANKMTMKPYGIKHQRKWKCYNQKITSKIIKWKKNLHKGIHTFPDRADLNKIQRTVLKLEKEQRLHPVIAQLKKQQPVESDDLLPRLSFSPYVIKLSCV